MLRAAIVGLGWWGRVLVASVDGSPNIEFRRAVSLDLNDAAPFCAGRGIDLTDQLSSVLADPDIDAVVLATPHSAHVNQIIWAAGARKHVFTEKPLALTYMEAERAVAACETAGVLLGIGTDKRFIPAVLRLADVVRSGDLGDVVHCEANYSNDNSSTPVYSAWRLSPSESPCGGMSGPGLHALDALVALVGGVETVRAMLRVFKEPPQPVDTVTATLTFESGATGTVTTTRGVPELFRILVVGTRGWAAVAGFSHFRMCTEAGVVDEVHSSELATGFLLEQFAKSIERGEPFPVSPTSMLRTVAAFEGVVRSASSGEPTTIPHVSDRSGVP